MRDMVQLEYNERMQIQLMNPKQGEKIIEIGEVDHYLHPITRTTEKNLYTM